MAQPTVSFLAVVVLLTSSGLYCTSVLPACSESCTCPRASLLNCSSSGLSSIPQLIHDSISELDLSHNLLNSIIIQQPHQNFRSLWMGNNSLSYLSLCMDRNVVSRFLRHRLKALSGEGCLPWAPGLQMLSVERNQLEQLPDGVNSLEFLQILYLSFNKITSVRPQELSKLRELKELYLQHNLITHLHPQMFQDLIQLRVLDLRFNMLTSLHPLMYITLSNIRTEVRLRGNKWRCDCRMRGLRRRMAYDHSRGIQTWSVVCASPSIHMARGLLQLDEELLECSKTDNSPDLHNDVTVYSGTEILLNCSAEESLWWTPSEASVNHHQGGVLISDVSEKNEGLYVCVSEDNKVLSVFNLKIRNPLDSKQAKNLPRLPREATQDKTNTNNVRMTRATQADLALAVCLSIFFTFLIAFILGVLARPFIDVLWKRFTKRKSSPSTNSASTAEQRQYDNEAFSDVDEPMEMGAFRERRVTFNNLEHKEERGVQYYHTTAREDQSSITSDVVSECETSGDSRSSNNSQRNSTVEKQSDDSTSSDGSRSDHHRDNEYTPDPPVVERGRSVSSSSSSNPSLSDEGSIKKIHEDPKSSQVAKDSLQQRENEVPHVSESKIPGFSSDPFADWSQNPNKKNSSDSSSSEDDGEEFEFSDSSQSTRSESRVMTFRHSKERKKGLKKRLDVKELSKSSESSDSSSSSDSESKTKHRKHQQDGIHLSIPSPKISQTGLQPYEDQWPVVYLKQITRLKKRLDVKAPPQCSEPSSSSDSEDETLVKTEKFPGQVLKPAESEPKHPGPPRVHWQTPPIDKEKDVKATSSDSSSSSGSEVELGGKKYGQEDNHISSPSPRVPSTVIQPNDDQRPVAYLKRITRLKKRLDVKAPPQSTESSSSSDSENETLMKKEKFSGEISQPVRSEPRNPLSPRQDWQTTPIYKEEDLKVISSSSNSSSSSDSEDDTTGQNHGQNDIHISRPPLKTPQTVIHHNEDQRPIVYLKQITRLKKRLDVKGPSQTSESSSSSDSEYETLVKTKRFPIEVSEPVSLKSKHPRPSREHGETPPINKEKDVKATSSSSDSSPSSDSEEELESQKYGQDDIHVSRPLPRVPQTGIQSNEDQRHVVYFKQITRLQKRLDFKAPPQSTESSSSSDSENETLVKTERFPGEVFQPVRSELKYPWPPQEHWQTPQINKKEDLKGTSSSSYSSSSSDSEDDTTGQNHRQNYVQISRPPPKTSQTVIQSNKDQWPIVYLQRITRLKRRLDVKAPSQSSESSSSSEGEDETLVKTERCPVEVSQPVKSEPKYHWSPRKLEPPTSIEKAVYVNVSSSSDASSTSDSEDETRVRKNGQNYMSQPPPEVLQTVIQHNRDQRPIVYLKQITRLKKRLDVKAPSLVSESSSDSDDETLVKIDRFPVEVSKPVKSEPKPLWPPQEQWQTPLINKVEDFKVSSSSSNASSSSESEDETKGKKCENEKLIGIRNPPKVSQTISDKPANKWPVVNLKQITRLKRRLDVKAPSQSPNSTSSSGNEDEIRGHASSWRPEILGTGRPQFEEALSKELDPDARWPVLDLKKVPHITRRLDIKVKSRSSITMLPHHEMEILQPSVGPGLTTMGKGHPHDKATSSSSETSSSSGSEDEKGVQKQEQGELHVTRPPPKVLQTVRPQAPNQWPIIDLKQTRLKRRLDFRGPSQSSDSSSSSESEDETRGSAENWRPDISGTGRPSYEDDPIKKPDPDAKWPVVDLKKLPQITRRLDIKVKSQSSITMPPHHELEILQPSVDPGLTTPGKGYPQYKATSSSSESSSSSDSEDEKGVQKQEQEELYITRPPLKVPQTSSPESPNQWPIMDLKQTRLKRRLDFRGPSQSSDSSSSSESEDKTGGSAENWRPDILGTGRPSYEDDLIKKPDPDAKWPVVDLKKLPQITRRLDIKVKSQSSITMLPHCEMEILQPSVGPGLTTPGKGHPHYKATSSSSESSSSSDSEDEKGVQKQEQEELYITRPTLNVPQTSSPESPNQWPIMDLKQTRLKRRLDFRGPSQSSVSSSSSESEDETRGSAENWRPDILGTGRPSYEDVLIKKPDPDARWPVVDLKKLPQITRRLDIKVKSQSSITMLPHHEMEILQPSVGPGLTTPGKGHPHYKATSSSSESSSSSDSEDEKGVQKQEQEELYITRPTLNVTQTSSSESPNQWPIMDLKQTRLKRRLNIKAPLTDFVSSTSSDSEDETIRKKSEDELNKSVLPTKQSETIHKPNNQLAPIHLDHIPSIKKRLDMKTRLPLQESTLVGGNTGVLQQGKVEAVRKSSSNSSSSSSDDINEKDFTMQPVASETDPTFKWPKIDLSGNLHVQKHLDIKGNLPPSELSSTSDANFGLPGNLTMTEERDTPYVGVIPKMTRRLDVKAPSLHYPVPSNNSLGSHKSESYSSTSGSEDENKVHKNKVESKIDTKSPSVDKKFRKYPNAPRINLSRSLNEGTNVILEKYTITDEVSGKTDTISTTPEISKDLQTKWAMMKLGISRTRQRFEITSHTKELPDLTLPTDSLYSPSSEGGYRRRARLKKQMQERGEKVRNSNDKYIPTEQVEGGVKESYTFHENEQSKPSVIVVDFGSSQTKKGLDFGVSEKAIATSSQQSSHSSSSSSSGDEGTDQGIPDQTVSITRIKRRLNIKAPSPEPSNFPSSFSDSSRNESMKATVALHNQADDSSTTYNRSTILALPLSQSSFTSTKADTLTVEREATDRHLTPPRGLSLSFDNTIQSRIEQSRSNTNVDLPRELRWTGVGHDSALSKSKSVYATFMSLPEASSAHNFSRSSSVAEIKPNSGKSDETFTYKYPSLGARSISSLSSNASENVGSSPSRTNETSKVSSVDIKERRGLGALKDMAIERRAWDTGKTGSSLIDNQSSQDGKSPIYPEIQLGLSLNPADERRSEGLMFRSPRNRRHDIQPPKDAPPPVPDTPLPDY